VDPRIVEMVGQLDRLVPVEGSDVLAYLEPFFQSRPRVDRQRHDVLFLATVRVAADRTSGLVTSPGRGTLDRDQAVSPIPAEAMGLLRDLDHLVPAVRGEVLITVPEHRRGAAAQMTGTQEGLLRFGLEFAHAALVRAAGKGRNRGERLYLALDDVLDAASEVEFHCERVAVPPAAGSVAGCNGVLNCRHATQSLATLYCCGAV